jgi:PadR family transcriptional regulator AphA
MAERLTTTSYAVLAQVAVHPWSTYELARQRIRYFRYVWPRAESAIYREVKRLSSMGLLDGRKEHVGKRARTVYSITEKGRQALREWLATPVSPFAMDFEAMIRLFVAPLGTKDQILATLRQVRSDARDMLRFGGQVKQEFLDGLAVTQDQVYIRALAVDFFISLLTMVEAWAERTLEEVGSWEDLSPDG